MSRILYFRMIMFVLCVYPLNLLNCVLNCFKFTFIHTTHMLYYIILYYMCVGEKKNMTINCRYRRHDESNDELIAFSSLDTQFTCHHKL